MIKESKSAIYKDDRFKTLFSSSILNGLNNSYFERKELISHFFFTIITHTHLLTYPIVLRVLVYLFSFFIL